MSSWSYADTTVTHDAPPAPLSCEVYPGQTLYGSSRYLVIDFIGEGQFGKVAKCRNIDTAATVAVKILKKAQAAERELAMLDAISVLDPVKSCVLQFHECFEDLGRTCMSFEMLDRSLEMLLEDRGWMPLLLKEIRPITQQLLLALESLSGLGLIHSDLKLDNIMLVDQQAEPFRVKLIDFGVAFKVSSIPLGLMVQPLGFRAPEVTLGLPLTQAIDMWGLGCVLVHLYLSDLLFTAESDDVMSVLDLLDKPEDQLISSGVVTQTATAENEHCHSPTWRLKTPDEHRTESSGNLEHDGCCLDNLIDVYPKEDDTEYKDRKAFVSLLKQLLQLDPRQRTSPVQALRHPFVTMSHLENSSSSYVTASQTLMSVCPVPEPAVGASELLSGVYQEPDSSTDGDAETVSSTGGAAAGGTFTGGAAADETSTDGAAADETSTDGAAADGTFTGGAAAGGTSTGGAAADGTFTGGAAETVSSTGGAAADGTFTGGAAADGTFTGGAAADGTFTGGAAAGGTSTGGAAAGGTSTGGAAADGTFTGGAAETVSSTGGAAADGTFTGGAAADGTFTGGAAAGGTFTGGAAETVSSTGGAAADGTFTGGAAAGGTFTGGAAAGQTFLKRLKKRFPVFRVGCQIM